MTQTFRITLLPGDGIGPEIMAVTVEVLKQVGSQLNLTFEFTEALMGGIAIDEAGSPLPEETLTACRNWRRSAATSGIPCPATCAQKRGYWGCGRG